MVDQQEKLWTFDAVEPGQIGNETVVEITAENIAEYARLALNDSEAYHSATSGLVAMPTMVLSYAPLLREEIAEANEFVAKPFSIGSILSRLQSVIDRPRQFAATNSYFGPCRRRISKDLPSDVPKDRRRVGESHANIVYSATDIKRQPEGSDVYLFKFPNFLKQKMGLEKLCRNLPELLKFVLSASSYGHLLFKILKIMFEK